MIFSDYHLIIIGAALAILGHLFSFERDKEKPKEGEAKKRWDWLGFKKPSAIGWVALGVMVLGIGMTLEKTSQAEDSANNKEAAAIAYRDSIEDIHKHWQLGHDSILNAVRDSLVQQSQFDKIRSDSTLGHLQNVIRNVAHANDVLTASYYNMNTIAAGVSELGYPLDRLGMKIWFTAAKKDMPIDLDSMLLMSLEPGLATFMPFTDYQYEINKQQMRKWATEKKDIWSAYLNRSCLLQIKDDDTHSSYYTYLFYWPNNIRIQPMGDSVIFGYTWAGYLVCDSLVPYMATLPNVVGKRLDLVINAGGNGKRPWPETMSDDMGLIFENGYGLEFALNHKLPPPDVKATDFTYGDCYSWYLSPEIRNYLIYMGKQGTDVDW